MEQCQCFGHVVNLPEVTLARQGKVSKIAQLVHLNAILLYYVNNQACMIVNLKNLTLNFYRIEKLEMLDEVNLFYQLLNHYCISWAFNDENAVGKPMPSFFSNFYLFPKHNITTVTTFKKQLHQ